MRHICFAGRTAPAFLAVALLFIGCNGGQGNVRHIVNGTLDIANVDCEVELPDQVRVSVQLLGGDDPPDPEVQVFPIGGPFTFTLEWPAGAGQADGWRVVEVTGADGNEICTREDTCAPGQVCLDLATKPRRANLGDAIDWRIRCTCSAAGG